MTRIPGHFPQAAQPRRSHAAAASGTRAVGGVLTASCSIQRTALSLRLRQRLAALGDDFCVAINPARANRKTASSNGFFNSVTDATCALHPAQRPWRELKHTNGEGGATHSGKDRDRLTHSLAVSRDKILKVGAICRSPSACAARPSGGA